MTVLRPTTLRTITAAIFCALMTAGTALAGPPLATDDAGTVDVGKVEMELNASYSHDKETVTTVTAKNTSAAEMKITTGLYENMGISLVIPYTVRERVKEDDQLVGNNDGFGGMTVEIKYIFARQNGINLAIKPSVIIPTGKSDLTEGHWQFGTTLIATGKFDEGKYAVHVNLDYEHHAYNDDEAGVRSDLWSGSIAGEMEVTKGLCAVAGFGLGTNPDNRSDDPPAYTLAGARYEINDHLDVNAGIKLGLTKPEDDISILYGLVLKF
ncbi:MAG: transporter [Desulfuromonadaceae bacterium]|nr:transporter [Desulfuromonadaceae bacterium]